MFERLDFTDVNTSLNTASNSDSTMRQAKRIVGVVICVIVVSLCVAMLQEFNASRKHSNYHMIREPVRDALNVRWKLDPFDGVKHGQQGGLDKESYPVIALSNNLDVGKPAHNQRPANVLNGGKQGDGSPHEMTEHDINGSHVAVIKNGTNPNLISRKTEANVLNMVEDIIQKDDTRSRPLEHIGLDNYTCPDMFRVVNGVEDLLCMVSILTYISSSSTIAFTPGSLIASD